MLNCPNCGKRHVGEFTFRGEHSKRPSQEEDFSSWTHYVFMNENIRGKQTPSLHTSFFVYNSYLRTEDLSLFTYTNYNNYRIDEAVFEIYICNSYHEIYFGYCR
jgi:sarcosine oxidase delta subunit